MTIDRVKVKKIFGDYVENYDSSDEKIKLKIAHTYRVSDLCEKIAISLGLDSNDVDIAYLTGVLHDIGRFEQVKRYGTFNDFNSINHAKLSASILFDEEKIRDFIEDTSEDELIKKVVEYHNAYKLPDDFNDREKMFCNILRDADKIDILKVNVLVPSEEVYNVTTEELYNSEVTEEVMANFREHDTILRPLKKSAVDNIVGHISLLFGLVYNESFTIVIEQGYLNKMLKFESKNPKTNKQFNEIREIIKNYMRNIYLTI